MDTLESLNKLAAELDKRGEWEFSDRIEHLMQVYAGIPKDLTKTEKKYLREAEEAVEDQYDKDSEKYWGTVTNIFKAKVNKHLGYDPFKKRKKKKKDKEKKKKKSSVEFPLIK